MKTLIILLCATVLVSCGGRKKPMQQMPAPKLTYTFMTILTEEPELIEESGRFAVSMEKGTYTSDIITLIDGNARLQDTLKATFERQTLRLMEARERQFEVMVARSDASTTDKEWLLKKGKAGLLESRMKIFDSRQEAEAAREKQKMH